MRFEIKTGGWILIALGLAGLSFIVFALGLFAGYDMARNTAPETPQAASVYPLPNPPPAPEVAEAPAAAPDQGRTTKAPANLPGGKTKPSGSSASSLAMDKMDKDVGPIALPPGRSVANVGGGIAAAKIAPTDATTDAKASAGKPVTANPPSKYAAASDASAGHHKPFNIQIDAAMDRTNAEQMTARLQKLGYRAFMVPTDISGQTWWRVRVGPYQSQEEASTAEQELRAKYRDTYTP